MANPGRPVSPPHPLIAHVHPVGQFEIKRAVLKEVSCSHDLVVYYHV